MGDKSERWLIIAIRARDRWMDFAWRGFYADVEEDCVLMSNEGQYFNVDKLLKE